MFPTPKPIISEALPLLNSPHRIPPLGFGVYQSHGSKCVASCLKAFSTGYRLVDTAQYYGNEAQVGHAVRESGLARSDIFITSKILSPGEDVDATYARIEASVRKLDSRKEGGYVDLFLIHSPNGGSASRKLMWLALERAKSLGKVHDIGVSNYGIGHIEEMREYATTWPPVVNQIELHPWCQQRETVAFCTAHNIVIEAYCPLVRNQKAGDATLVGIAAAKGKSPGQVLLRWSLQKGWVPLPKSDSPVRIEENADIFSFKLSREEMAALDGLDRGRSGAIVQAVTNEI
ncbi:aldo-keto reductase [Delitschia confertaspora ATCC 74209]|uniref:Aldo-keto reductase n=1 Tax=Delitschia confertaspora ATCC 74209 TaxID=1513339 RepID=A0A9P4MU45_9PLEO|nr:aldo-keto reductase [Delitschia confertaspora ATCC 74209]